MASGRLRRGRSEQYCCGHSSIFAYSHPDAIIRPVTNCTPAGMTWSCATEDRRDRPEDRPAWAPPCGSGRHESAPRSRSCPPSSAAFTPSGRCTSPGAGCRWAIAMSSAIQHELGAQMVSHRPADDPAGERVQHDRPPGCSITLAVSIRLPRANPWRRAGTRQRPARRRVVPRAGCPCCPCPPRRLPVNRRPRSRTRGRRAGRRGGPTQLSPRTAEPHPLQPSASNHACDRATHGSPTMVHRRCSAGAHPRTRRARTIKYARRFRWA
jgi:hypothetical protein